MKDVVDILRVYTVYGQVKPRDLVPDIFEGGKDVHAELLVMANKVDSKLFELSQELLTLVQEPILKKIESEEVRIGQLADILLYYSLAE